jgi:hypothetical protein
MAATKKAMRKDTTETHPLFGGSPEQYNKDRKWRRSVPKAKAEKEKKK